MPRGDKEGLESKTKKAMENQGAPGARDFENLPGRVCPTIRGRPPRGPGTGGFNGPVASIWRPRALPKAFQKSINFSIDFLIDFGSILV